MKNRVLRSALAVILVIAMVLTMAACGDSTTEDVVTTTTPAATAAPAATETPVAPTEAPVVTTAPTVAPTTSVEKDTVADDFGITLTAVDGTFNTKSKNLEGDTMSDAYTATAYGYYMLEVDEDYYSDEQYTVIIYSGDDILYTNLDASDEDDEDVIEEVVGTSYNVLVVEETFDVDYDGENDSNTSLTMYADEDNDGVYYFTAKVAGTFEMEVEVYVVDSAVEYGAWDDTEDKEEYETTLTSILEVARHELSITFSPIVVPATEDELEVSEIGDVTIGEDDYGNLLDGISKNPLSGDSPFSFEFSISYVEEAEVGTYVVDVIIVDASGDEAEIDEVNDELFNYTINSISSTSIYVISSYDWNELRDVVTSIVEIEGKVTYDASDADGKSDAILTINNEDQLTLALARYNALSTEQQAWFTTGSIENVGIDIDADVPGFTYLGDYEDFVSGTSGNSVVFYDSADEANPEFSNGRYIWIEGSTVDGDVYGTLVERWILEDANYVTNVYENDEKTYYTDDDYSDTYEKKSSEAYYSTAKAYYKFLAAAEDAVELKVLIDAFDDYAEEAGIDGYFDGSFEYDLDSFEAMYESGGDYQDDDDYDFANHFDADDNNYYTSNSSAITAFNLVNAYWNALSEDDQDDIEANASDWVTMYLAAKDDFDLAEVTAVQELIVGAFNAYTKALENSAKVIYQYETTDTDANILAWAYINSTEVKSLTSQAQAAYDALTDDQKDLLEGYLPATAVSGLLAGGATNDDDADYGLVDYSSVVFADNDDTSGSEVYNNTFKIILDQLTAMNEMVETMITVANYVNIADYSVDGAIYDRLNALVYGEEIADGEAGLYYNDRFAMEDIIDAPTRNYDAIISEYQAWIDFLLYVEDYKADLADDFAASAADYVAELDSDDYKASTLSTAGNMSNKFAEAIKDAIMNEVEELEGTDSTEFDKVSIFAAYFGDDNTFAVTSGNLFYSGIFDNYESLEELIEDLLADYCDYDEVAENYAEAVANPPEIVD